MDTRNVYANKAEKYARYRWDYAHEAVEEIIRTTGLCTESIVADIGAGTGILTRHFCGRVGQIYAIEPNSEMRLEAARQLNQCQHCRLIDASAEATGLDNQSIDLITVAQAIHWFDPAAARREFTRILKPGGWLALLRNYPTGDQQLADAMREISTEEYGVPPVHGAPANNVSPDVYFGHGPAHRSIFSFSFEQDWDGFFGALCSASFTPDESHPLFPKFAAAARKIFDHLCNQNNGRYQVTGETELILGVPV